MISVQSDVVFLTHILLYFRIVFILFIVNFLHADFPHILCLSEHHLNQLELETVCLGNYTLGASYCRHAMKMGGVCIYVHRDLSFSKIDLSSYSIDQHFEASAIFLPNSFDYIYIISVYRAPSGNFTLFLKELEIVLNLFFRNNTKIGLCGDINVNYSMRQNIQY
jgi:exonuclease III